MERTNFEDNDGTAAVVADIATQFGAAEWVDVGESRAHLAVLPTGKRIEDLTPLLDKYLAAPLRRRGDATLTDTQSFISHVLRFKGADTAIFANPSAAGPSLYAVYDYHPAGPDVKKAAFGGHRAVYAPALSESWKAWQKNDGKPMLQADFAAFIEEHLPDVVVANLDDPDIATFANLVQGRFADPSQLLALSRGLQVNVETVVKNAVMLSTGEINVTYDEQHKDGAGAPISVPNLFQICVPVFYADALYRLAVRLRYRISNGKLSWSYLLVRPDIVFDHAVRSIVEKVSTETDVPVFLGTAEK